MITYPQRGLDEGITAILCHKQVMISYKQYVIFGMLVRLDTIYRSSSKVKDKVHGNTRKMLPVRAF